ncbi:SlyX family protein [Halomonas sp. YLGW01]|uniref:SlyX family protein n=1 Tax=Halomonas sp. YLGW01 TaxID=2773308 RepID=UPI001780A08B|nr:SlyX family protein [Halomonas sp. YLGW01]
MQDHDWLARLEGLESRIAYQEHWLDTLDQAVAAQETRLATLERMSELMQARLRQQQRALDDGSGEQASLDDERPPHY